MRWLRCFGLIWTKHALALLCAAGAACRPRDPAKLREDVLAMRRKMVDAHAGKSELFDLKHDPGGLVDVEFIVQYLVLAHSQAQPRLLGNLGNIALLRIAGELGLIDPGQAKAAGNAYRDTARIDESLSKRSLEVVSILDRFFADPEGTPGK